MEGAMVGFLEYVGDLVEGEIVEGSTDGAKDGMDAIAYCKMNKVASDKSMI